MAGRLILFYPVFRDPHFDAELSVDHFYHYAEYGVVSLLKQLVSARNPTSISALTANMFCCHRLIVLALSPDPTVRVA